MLPELTEIGYLPRGIHLCRLDEAVQRFGVGSEERETGAAELSSLVKWARAAGVARLLVDGSFVTDKTNPNDVDVVILRGADYPREELPVDEADKRWPCLHVQIAEDADDFLKWADVDFGMDRRLVHRGVVEIVL